MDGYDTNDEGPAAEDLEAIELFADTMYEFESLPMYEDVPF